MGESKMNIIPELELPAVEKRIKSLHRAVEIGQCAERPAQQTIDNLLLASALYHERKRRSRGRSTNR
jgi:hypothetical protein